MFSKKLRAAIHALTAQLDRSTKAMTAASDQAKASADKIVGVMESLLAAMAKASADLAAAIAAGASASDPAFQAIADELNAETAKAEAVLTPPAPAA